MNNCDICKKPIPKGIVYNITVRVDEAKENDVKLDLCEPCNKRFWDDYQAASPKRRGEIDKNLIKIAGDNQWGTNNAGKEWPDGDL